LIFKKYTLVHNHSTEIYNLFWLDDGHVLFSAADGWWATTDTGLVWNRLDLWASSPAARNLTAVGLQEGSWILVAYGQDHKIYRCAYPGGQWSEVFDTTAIHSDKWYPAMAADRQESWQERAISFSGRFRQELQGAGRSSRRSKG